MPTFNERPPALMTVRPSIWVELLGFAVMSLGIAAVGWYCWVLFQQSVHLWWWAAGGLVLTGVGFQRVFDEERLVLDRRTETVFLRRPLRKHVHWSFDQIETVELLMPRTADGSPPPKRALKECRLRFKDGQKLRVFRGRIDDMDEMAGKLSEYTRAPLAQLPLS